MQIEFNNCAIYNKNFKLIDNITWKPHINSSWVIIGQARNFMAKAITGDYDIQPNPQGFYIPPDSNSIFSVSFDYAQKILEFERKNDDSDFIEGGIDIGRTPRKLIQQLSGKAIETNIKLIQLLRLENILDRGLKFLSTGEIKKTLLCAAFMKNPELLILEDPYDGLDIQATQHLNELLSNFINRSSIFLIMDGNKELPSMIKNLIEIDKKGVCWLGETANCPRKTTSHTIQIDTGSISASFTNSSLVKIPEAIKDSSPLVDMKNVTVSWSGRTVLENITWTLNRGEHWLIRGPNGSGKTTFLELISGDNPQAYSNEIYLFGAKRGSGETIWDLRKKIGLVSWKLHNEYRYFGGLTVEQVIVSGLHDSIGLYEQCGDFEKKLVNQWLGMSTLHIKTADHFGNLSYGEQRAVLILRAAVKLPEILILDEPCHGLDYEQQQIIAELLEQIADQKLSTLLHVTHNPEESLSCEHHILEFDPQQKPMYRILTR